MERLSFRLVTRGLDEGINNVPKRQVGQGERGYQQQWNGIGMSRAVVKEVHANRRRRGFGIGAGDRESSPVLWQLVEPLLLSSPRILVKPVEAVSFPERKNLPGGRGGELPEVNQLFNLSLGLPP